MCPVLLQVADLTVRYGRAVHGLSDVSLDVPEGSVTAVLGANGAGKSTLLRAISGTLKLHRGRVTAGSVTFNGTDITAVDPAAIVAAGIVQVPEGRQVFATMSVEENLRAGAFSLPRGQRLENRERVLDLFPRLGERLGQRAGLLSGGEQQMLAMGRALMSEPKLLLLDEPSLGLAPQMITLIGQIVSEINSAGTSVLLVEQNAAMALKASQHVMVLEVGRVALRGEADDVANSPELAGLYLGGHGKVSEEIAAAQASKEASDETSEEQLAPVSSRTLSKWQG
ncbi:MAG TPA: ABC transporter ATP-binding protein [Sporichthyaceae bacterium]|jgi:branched-chain amino acid transport system ATP-binding protein